MPFVVSRLVYHWGEITGARRKVSSNQLTFPNAVNHNSYNWRRHAKPRLGVVCGESAKHVLFLRESGGPFFSGSRFRPELVSLCR